MHREPRAVYRGEAACQQPNYPTSAMNPINAINLRNITAVAVAALMLISCSDSGQRESKPLLEAQITLPEFDRSIKTGEAVYFDGAAKGGQAPYAYRWHFGTGISDSTEKTPGNITFSFEGSYTVEFSVTDTDKKISLDQVIIEVARDELTPG